MIKKYYSAFKQQRLPAWQPILTAGTVLPAFFVIGIAFIPVGISLLYFSDKVNEHVIDYTNCNETIEYTGRWIPTNRTCQEIIQNNTNQNCTCRINFSLNQDFTSQVYMYYGLSNFYQNHRRYVKSRDDNQLLGNLENVPATDCAPFAYTNDSNGILKPIAPCGAIANSMFNDNLTLVMWENPSKPVEVRLIKTGIAWESDKKIKFKNPPIPNGGSLKEAFKNYVKPEAWKMNIWELDLEDENNNGFENEDFIVWMRTAALPTFRKLYRKVDPTKFNGGLVKANYTLTVYYNYDVSTFDGSKRMILSTTSLLGGKNPFLGIAYIVVGCVCLLLGIALLFIHIKCGKSTSEMINVNPTTSYNVNPSTSYQ